jgi:hypothetical protein
VKWRRLDLIRQRRKKTREIRIKRNKGRWREEKKMVNVGRKPSRLTLGLEISFLLVALQEEEVTWIVSQKWKWPSFLDLFLNLRVSKIQR